MLAHNHLLYFFKEKEGSHVRYTFMDGNVAYNYICITLGDLHKMAFTTLIETYI